MDISEVLRQLRARYGYTQEYIAEVLGIHYTNYANYERGKTVPKVTHAKKLADLYKISLDELFSYGEEVPFKAPDKNVIEEGIEQYLKKKKHKSVSLTVELDGTTETVNHYLKLIQDLNKVVAASL